jgi:hypothetical protein
MPFVQDFEVKRQRRQQQEQPVLEEQSIKQEQPVLEEQQPETSNDSAVVDDILDVDFSGFEW